MRQKGQDIFRESLAELEEQSRQFNERAIVQSLGSELTFAAFGVGLDPVKPWKPTRRATFDVQLVDGKEFDGFQQAYISTSEE